MIKSIQFAKAEVPVTGGKIFYFGTVDPAKTVILPAGSSYVADATQGGGSTISDGGTNYHALSPAVNVAICEVRVIGAGGYTEIAEGSGFGAVATPYFYALSASQLTVKMIAMPNVTFSAGYSWQVIEHKAQVVMPVIVSISATSCVINWSVEPTVVADVSLIIIEYI